MIAQNTVVSKSPIVSVSQETVIQQHGIRLQALVEEMISGVLQTVQEHLPLHELERQTWARLLAMGHEVLALLFALLGPGDVGETVTLGEGHKLRRLLALHHRPYQSPFGDFDHHIPQARLGVNDQSPLAGDIHSPIAGAALGGLELEAVIFEPLANVEPLAMLAVAVFALLARTYRRCAWKSGSRGTRAAYALHSHLQQLPILCGQLAFHHDRIRGRRRMLIEYRARAS